VKETRKKSGLDPVEKSIYMAGLEAPGIGAVIKKLNFRIKSTVRAADACKNKFIIDLGHDTSRLIKPENTMLL